MKFYYENFSGDSGYFSEKNIVKAIYTAWNIEADLYLINKGLSKINWNECMNEQCTIIFAPYEGNEFNSDVLKPFGYYMQDGETEREIRRLDNGNKEWYDWSEVRSLI